ncbi:protein nipsnap [Dermatophagoides farinae]|uniref:Nipsnap n=1 Tax=Dermatophagoides farinae TaxID=6954 RepID=A0A922LC01_DERFA|nr:Nipsnap [Dermatophagoides farinae]
MAFLRRLLVQSSVLVATTNKPKQLVLARCIASTAVNNESENWLSKLLMVRKIDTGKEAHSRLLSDTDKVYELHIHDVKPRHKEEYLQNFQAWCNEIQTKSPEIRLVGSWKVEVGDLDQYVHIWGYDGWKQASQVFNLIRSDRTLMALEKDQEPFLRSRQNQFMLSFSFWPSPQPQVNNSMYEMRSYVLKPGTMIEWGNNWARGINFRRNNAIAGFFSQIGQLYCVHHLWKYDDLQARREIREAAWRKPGWDECVAYTVPLIRELRTRWMSPNPFSPIK